MRFKNFVWSFPGVIDSGTCDQIIEYALSQELTQGMTSSGNVSVNRDSEVVWLYDPWILDLIHPYVKKANQEAGWNLQWEEVMALQFTKYGHDQYYDWHRDSFMEPDTYGKIRKLSVTVNLNDDFEGGDMYFDNEIDYGKTKPIQNYAGRPKGSINVFPSHVWHKVDRVTKGIRYSLVVWFKGDPVK